MRRFFAAMLAVLSLSCAGILHRSCAVPPEEAIRAAAVQDALPLPSVPDLTGKLVVIGFDGDVDDKSVGAAVEALMLANNGHAGAILFTLNTDGGSVTAGERLARELERSNVPVTCLLDGRALSMGFYLMQACGTRLMTPWSIFMAHEPWRNVQAANWHELQRNSTELKIVSEAIVAFEARRLKMTREEFIARIADQEWWMGADEALKVGVVDGIADGEKAVVSTLRAALEPSAP